MAAVGIGTDLGKRGLDKLVDSSVRQAVDRELAQKMDPRLAAMEGRLAAIESRLDMADRLAKLEAEIAALKASK